MREWVLGAIAGAVIGSIIWSLGAIERRLDRIIELLDGVRDEP